MIKAPVSNPTRARLIVAGLGIVGILVARFLPAEQALFRSIVDIVGVGLFGAGGVSIVQAPKHGGP